ncbi:MAG: hypothetical protein WBD31_02615, partial [Rubripirellula sp.]
MRFSIGDLILVPPFVLAAYPVVCTASGLGLLALPRIYDDRARYREWFLERGFAAEFVNVDLTLCICEIPTVSAIVLLIVFLFAVRTRACDLASVVWLASIPFVQAIAISRIYGNGLQYLATQSLTGLTLAAIIAAYVLARLWIPIPSPTRTRTVVS